MKSCVGEALEGLNFKVVEELGLRSLGAAHVGALTNRELPSNFGK